MTVKLDDKEISNWVDYVQTKFADKSLYDVKKGDDGFEIKSKTNKTTIWFNIDTNAASLNLYDCQYCNDDCKGWSGETTAANSDWGIFNQKNVDTLNEVLQTPISNGWLSVDYYFGDSLLKSKTYYDNNKNSTPFVHHHGGCLAIVLFPLFWLLNKLIDLGLLGRKKETLVTPIQTATR